MYADTVGPGSELAGATVQLGQSSYCSPTRGRYQATTGPDGSFEFEKVFFHDTDRVWIEVESTGYDPARWDSTDVSCLHCDCFASPIEISLHSSPGQ